jgi:hypothetical protein
MSATPPDPRRPQSPAAPPGPEADRQGARQRLAELLGRLLARHWLKARRRGVQGGDNRPPPPEG